MEWHEEYPAKSEGPQAGLIETILFLIFIFLRVIDSSQLSSCYLQFLGEFKIAIVSNEKLFYLSPKLHDYFL